MAKKGIEKLPIRVAAGIFQFIGIQTNIETVCKWFKKVARNKHAQPINLVLPEDITCTKDVARNIIKRYAGTHTRSMNLSSCTDFIIGKWFASIPLDNLQKLTVDFLDPNNLRRLAKLQLTSLDINCCARQIERILPNHLRWLKNMPLTHLRIECNGLYDNPLDELEASQLISLSIRLYDGDERNNYVFDTDKLKNLTELDIDFYAGLVPRVNTYQWNTAINKMLKLRRLSLDCIGFISNSTFVFENDLDELIIRNDTYINVDFRENISINKLSIQYNGSAAIFHNLSEIKIGSLNIAIRNRARILSNDFAIASIRPNELHVDVCMSLHTFMQEVLAFLFLCVLNPNLKSITFPAYVPYQLTKVIKDQLAGKYLINFK
jgi:hypothetical protein